MVLETTNLLNDLFDQVKKGQLLLSATDWQTINQNLMTAQYLLKRDPEGTDPSIEAQICHEILSTLCKIPVLVTHFPEPLESYCKQKTIPTGIKRQKLSESQLRLQPLANRLITISGNKGSQKK